MDILNIPGDIHSSLDMSVSDYIVNGAWSLPDYFLIKDNALTSRILHTTLPFEPIENKLNWTASVDGALSNKLAYSFLAGNGQRVCWAKLLWNTYVPCNALLVI